MTSTVAADDDIVFEKVRVFSHDHPSRTVDGIRRHSHGKPLSNNVSKHLHDDIAKASLDPPTRSSSISSSKNGDLLYPPDPADAVGRKSVLKTTAAYIIVTEFCERLTYYGFAGSLVLFFQRELNYSNADADVQFSYWSALCYLTPLIGGVFADSVWNRYRTILLFSSMYLIGLVIVEVSIIPGKISAGTFFLGIYIIALGTGGIKPNVSTLGADQFDERYSKDRKEKESFFNWFYWSINLGALLSYTIVSYICQYGIPGLGGEDYSFVVGYSIPTVMMGMAILVFLSGTARYTVSEPQGSVLLTAIKICFEAIWVKRSELKGSEHLLDKAKISQGGSYKSSAVEGVKAVVRLFPFLVALIPYWGVYSQMSTVFQNQGCQMNLTLGSFPIPVSALNIFDTIAILLLVPVFDGYVYPYLKNQGRPLSMLSKIGWGLGFALLSMLVACIVEYFRLQSAPPAGNYYSVSARNNITPCQSLDDYNPYMYQAWVAGTNDVQPLHCSQICSDFDDDGTNTGLLDLKCISCNDIPQTSSLSVLAQIPQFALIGISEILASITSLEFFYSQAPLTMRSVSQAMNLVTTSIGSLLIVPLVYLVNSNPNNEWLPTNLDDGHVTYYFVVLAIIMLIDMLYFYYVSLSYEYKTTADLTFTDGEDSDYGQASNHLNEPLIIHNKEDTISSGDSKSVSGSLSYDHYSKSGDSKSNVAQMVGVRTSSHEVESEAFSPLIESNSEATV